MEAKKKAAKKASKKGSKFGEKADFVRLMPFDMPAKEVVEAAAKKGIHMTLNHVYNVRATAKNKAESGGTGPALGAPSGAARGPKEAEFRRLVLDIGLARSKQILGEVENRLNALISGR